MRKGRFLAATMAALALLLCAWASAEVKDVAGQCKFWVSEGSRANLADNSMYTAWTPEGEHPEARIMLPEGGAAWMQINWTYPPENYTFTEYDAEQNPIATRTQADDEFAPISQLLPLQPETRYVSIAFSQRKQGIHKIRVFPEGELPKTVVQWEKPLDKCDLMVVSTHQDDEWLWFGAIIPYYDLVKDKDVQVVYMANCGRYRYQEALNSIAVSGVRTYPQFVGLTDRRDDNLTQAIQTWKGKDHILDVMVAVIRRYKPEVILTHDWNGEYGHPQHILTSRCMEYAIEAAADPNQYPASAEEFGVWQVKKLYRHLEKKGRIAFDWHVAYPEFGGRTGIQVAIDSMNEHASQLKYYQVKDHGQYDNALFGLSWSAVGDDQLHEDLFENIPEATPTPEPTATPEPTPEPTEEPTPEPADEAPPEEAALTALEPADDPSAPEAALESTDEPETSPSPNVPPEPEPAASEESGGSAAPLIVGGAALLAAGAAYLFYTSEQSRRRRRRRKRHRSGKGASHAPSARSTGAGKPGSAQRKTSGTAKPASATSAKPGSAPRKASSGKREA